jgi:hypothetical protein
LVDRNCTDDINRAYHNNQIISNAIWQKIIKKP